MPCEALVKISKPRRMQAHTLKILEPEHIAAAIALNLKVGRSARNFRIGPFAKLCAIDLFAKARVIALSAAARAEI